MSQTTADLSMDERESLADVCSSAQNIAGEAKETGIHFLGTDETYTITSYKATIVKSILRHDLAEIDAVYLEDGSSIRSVTPTEALSVSGASVVGVEATIPLGTLTIKGTKRSNDHQSGIVSTPSQVQQARDALGDD